MASVRKKGDKWVCDYKDSKGVRRLKTFTHKKSADQFRNRTVQEVETGEHIADRETVTFATAADKWIRHLEQRAKMGDRMTNATVSSYRQSLSRVQHSLRSIRMAELRPEHLQATIDDLARRLAPATIRLTYRSAFMVCEWAIEQGWLAKNPVPQKRMRLPLKSKRVEVASKDDLRRILKAACERHGNEHFHAQRNRIAIVALALFGGMRRGEICGLRWQDVDSIRGVIHVRHSLSRLDGLKDPKTRAGVRDVPMTMPIVEALKGISDACQSPPAPEDFVLLSYKGKRLLPSHVTSDYWYTVLKRAGLYVPGRKRQYRFHALRHAAVSLLIDQGLSPIHIKTMIGHASVTTTLDVYGHLFPQDSSIKSAADSVAAALRATDTRPAALTH